MGDVALTPRPRPSTLVSVLIAGPYGVGKTEMVRTLSEVDVLTTDRRVPTEDVNALAMDFGRFTVEDDLVLYMFGVPSAQPLDPVWTIVGEGALGAILLVDHNRPDSAEDAMATLNWVREKGDIPFVVGTNRVNRGEEQRAIRQARHMLRLGEQVPVRVVDVRDRDSATALLIELFEAARRHTPPGGHSPR